MRANKRNIFYFQNVTCGRELTSLIINLFPTASWNDEGATRDILIPDDFINILDLIDFIEVHDLTKTNNRPSTKIIGIINSNSKSIDENPNFLQSFDEFDILNDERYRIDPVNLERYKTDDFCKHIAHKMSCKEFSSILLNLLAGLVQNENLTLIDNRSTTVKCLYFAIEKLELLNRNRQIFTNNFDRAKIRRKLLILILISLNKLFQLREKIISEFFKPKFVLKKLFEILEVDLEEEDDDSSLLILIKTDILFGVYYSIFVIINYSYSQKLDIIDFFRNCKHISSTVFNRILRVERSKFMFSKFLKIIPKIIVNIKITEDSGGGLKRKIRKYRRQYSVNKNHHSIKRSSDEMKCLLEQQLLNLLEILPFYQQKREILLYFKNYGLCCCNCNLSTIKIFVKIFSTTKFQKISLNFLRTNILRTIFDTTCERCTQIASSVEFIEELPKFYQKLISETQDDCEKCVILKHIGKNSINLCYEISNQILFNIIQPIFIETSESLLEQINRDRSESQREDDVSGGGCGVKKEVIKLCLKVFANYLTDVRLIKVFFDQILETIEKLIEVQELVQGIFSIIKIGLINVKVIDEVILTRLINIPIFMTIETTSSLIKLFNDLRRYEVKFKLKILPRKKSTNNFNFNANLLNILRLSAVYWNITLQLLQTNEQFKIEFYKRFSEQHEDNETFISLVFNSLSCILNVNQLKSNCEGVLCKILFHHHPSETIDAEQYKTPKNEFNYSTLDSDTNLPPIGISILELNYLEEPPKQCSILEEQFILKKITFLESLETACHIYNVNSIDYVYNLNELLTNLKIETKIQSIVELTTKHESSSSRKSTIIESVGRINRYLIGVIGTMFSTEEVTNSDEDVDQKDDEDDRTIFTESHLDDLKSIESKKLLFQLFEILLGVLVIDLSKSNYGKFVIFSLPFYLVVFFI